MKKYRVYVSVNGCTHVDIEAEDEYDAVEKVANGPDLWSKIEDCEWDYDAEEIKQEEK